MGNLFEYGNSADIILRAIVDFTVNDEEYKKDDVVFYFQDTKVRFTYNETIKDKTVAGRNIMAYDERKLNAMIVESTPLTREFMEVFAQKTADKFNRPFVESLDVADNKFYPQRVPSTDKLFIIGLGQFNFSTEFIGESTQYCECTLVSDNIITGTFEIIYDVEEQQSKFDINNNYTLPYLKAQILTTGNTDKGEGNMFFEVPRVSLLTRPDYSLDGQVMAQEIAFKIISDKSDGKVEVGVY